MNRRDAIKSLLAIPSVGAVTIAALKPGDVVVIEYDGLLRQDDAERLRAHVSEAFGGRQKVLVLEKGMRMQIARGDSL
jgi:hypothetical protein